MCIFQLLMPLRIAKHYRHQISMAKVCQNIQVTWRKELERTWNYRGFIISMLQVPAPRSDAPHVRLSRLWLQELLSAQLLVTNPFKSLAPLPLMPWQHTAFSATQLPHFFQKDYPARLAILPFSWPAALWAGTGRATTGKML